MGNIEVVSKKSEQFDNVVSMKLINQRVPSQKELFPRSTKKSIDTTNLPRNDKSVSLASNDQTVLYKRLMIIKERWQRMTDRQQKEHQQNELVKKLSHQESVIIPRMCKQTEEIREKTAVKKTEILRYEGRLAREKRRLRRKNNAIKSLEERFPEYEIISVGCMRSIKSRIDDYIIEILQEENELENKLNSFWRVLGKAKLQQEKHNLEACREKFTRLKEDLRNEIENLEFGFFKLNHWH